MKLKDLIKQVNRDVDDSYGTGDIIDWFNRCLDDLTPIAQKEAKTSYPIVSGNTYTLPSDLHKIVFVMVDNQEYDRVPQRDRSSQGYKIWGNDLSLQNGPTSGTIDLYFHKKLTHLVSTNLDAEPEIESEYHDLLILYAIGHFQFTEEDYDDRPDSLTRYYQRKEEYQKFVSDEDDSHEIKAVYCI